LNDIIFCVFLQHSASAEQVLSAAYSCHYCWHQRLSKFLQKYCLLQICHNSTIETFTRPHKNDMSVVIILYCNTLLTSALDVTTFQCPVALNSINVISLY